MTKYFLSINRLKSPPPLADFVDTICRHMRWCTEEIAAGRLEQAGKWGRDGGISIVPAANQEEAERVLSSDPLILSGLAAYEIAEFFPDKPYE